ncbi:HsdM family class I SAM-dependent methyltransferase [Micromonospora trifolii]|uniref:HsdM family class I SAM-dependent methyltransferase n=1 Tax=Micromonospora trifolii TaxID=2911208 RepID=UPI0035583A19
MLDAATTVGGTSVALDREHGEVYTQRWVVDLILDLVGYTDDDDLSRRRLLDPACGDGAFMVAAAERLSSSCRKHGLTITAAADALHAVDLQERNVTATTDAVTAVLQADGWDFDQVAAVVAGWVRHADFLLATDADRFDVIVGNPPYLRLEDISTEKSDAYRRACRTMVGRADIYVGFYEKALRRLRDGGALGFICADRWMRNQYGRALRGLVTSGFAVETVVTMHDVDAFLEAVSAYPAITVLRRARQGTAVVADTTRLFDATAAADFLSWRSDSASTEFTRPAFQAARMPGWFADQEPWPTGTPSRLAMIEEITEGFPLLEDTGAGTRVGIGIATGADAVYLTTNRIVAESDRLLPIAMVKDVTTGTLGQHDTFLVNPWEADGSLVDLARYPKLRAYFQRHREKLTGRYIAKRQPDRWYKTIDKVDATLTGREKLLFPDMRMQLHPVLDVGTLYPHHNLYFIVSDTWDLRVLGGLLLSDIAQAFVEAYAVRMRGGTLRFQAQYLRKIRVPNPESISAEDQQQLRDVFARRDREGASRIARRLYGVSHLST